VSSPGTLEADQVRSMFDRVAAVYDPLNSAMTAGLHHRWRARAVDMARVGPGSRVLDIATGTGDLALELVRRVAPGGEVLGSDFSEVMLARARAKARAAGHHAPGETTGVGAAGGAAQVSSTDVSLHFEWGDALQLPYANDSFDAATVGFGIRNFSDLARGLAEMTRVVKPGGRVVVLEMTTPSKPPLSFFYGLWFDRVVPVLGWLVGKLLAGASRLGLGSHSASTGSAIADAYTYLPSSVKRFPGPPALATAMQRAGLCEISYVLTAGGIIAIHAGSVPTRAGSDRADTGSVPPRAVSVQADGPRAVSVQADGSPDAGRSAGSPAADGP
jgi:demethylmenaquinone methyltransferase / 2-methoxy-6-polyprenyl-1,4-benzoquinol methylase